MYLEIYKFEYAFWNFSKAITHLLKNSCWIRIDFGRKKLKEDFDKILFQIFNWQRSIVLLNIDFDAINQFDIVSNVNKLSDLMSKRNIELLKKVQ